MGVEIATWIADLQPALPGSDDLVSQGDDHLRLIKDVLQTTFPDAHQAYIFPKTVALAGPYSMVAGDQNTIFFIPSGEVGLVLPDPTGLPSLWWCDVVKYTIDSGGATVSPQSGTIAAQPGSVATVRVGVPCSPVKFLWSGAGWFALKSGPPIGSTISFDGPSIPAGYLNLDGGTFSATTFAELALVLGTTTLRDKRGRVEAGVDGGTGRLTASATGFGVSAILGAVGGAESHTLTAAEMAVHHHTATLTDAQHTHISNGHNFLSINVNQGLDNALAGIKGYETIGPLSSEYSGVSWGSSNGAGTTENAGSGGAHSICMPTIITQKLIRAC